MLTFEAEIKVFVNIAFCSLTAIDFIFKLL